MSDLGFRGSGLERVHEGALDKRIGAFARDMDDIRQRLRITAQARRQEAQIVA